MKTPFLPSLLALIALAGCGKGGEKSAPRSTTATNAAVAPASSVAPAASVPIDPELQSVLAEAGKCEVGSNGLLQQCPADKTLATYVKAHKVDATLDACLVALDDAKVRASAASCLYQYSSSSSTVEGTKYAGRVFDRVLPVLATERDAKVRAAIAWAVGSLSADRAGKTGAVIAYVRTRLPDADAGNEISSLTSTLFEAYLMQDSPKPAAASMALANDLVRDARSNVREKAVWLLKAGITDETCHLLADVAEKEANDEVLDEVASAISGGGNLCEADFGRVAKAIAARIDKAADPKRGRGDDVNTIGGMRSFASNAAVSKESKQAIAKACDRWGASPKADKREKEAAKLLAASARAKEAPKK